MIRVAAPVAVALALLAAAPGRAADPTSFAAGADVRSAVAAMAAVPDKGFQYRPLVQGNGSVAALEYWRRPGKPAIHPDQTEYATVIAGAGTLVSGGTMADPSTTRPDLVEGSRIDGGTTRALKPGDVMLIPAGTPHWFGIPAGGRLVLLGMKVARRP